MTARRPPASPDRTIHMIGQAHLDAVWLWPWQEAYQEARATFWSAIHRMGEYPDFVFTNDQIVLLSWVEESDPALFEQIRRRVAEGRWVNVGGWWVEPDCNMPHGESFVRQGLLGQRFLLSRFGVMATVGMNVDPFGHNAMIPQILRGQGMDTYTFLRPGPHESDLHDNLFWWESPDGSRVLAWRIPFEYASEGGSVAWQTEKSLGQINASEGVSMVFYGVGNHGGGPTKRNIESIQQLDAMGSFGHMVLSTPPAFFEAVRADLGEQGLSALPVRTGDLQHHAPGCYSSHSGIKLWNRRAQHAALTAERWAAVAESRHHLPAARGRLEEMWKAVAFNQFHDILPGSAIESAYEDARDQLGEAVAIAKRITTQAHNIIARDIDTASATRDQPVVVFNPHPWPVRALVELNLGGRTFGAHVVDAAGDAIASQRIQSTATTDDGSRLALVFAVDLPSLGYDVVDVREGEIPPPALPGFLSVNATSIENDLLRVELDPRTGDLTSLRRKDTGIDVLAGARGGHARVSADSSDTWGHRVITYALPAEEMQLVRTVPIEEGPVRARLMVERSWGRSLLREIYTLERDADSIDVEVTIDWREQAHLLKLRFPTGLSSPKATFDIPFGHIERPVDGAEEPAQSWVDITGTIDGRSAGLAIVVNGKHGFDVSPADSPEVGNSPSIGMTALRSPVYAWHDPRTLDPDAVYSFQDQGIQRFRYLLVPHAGDWRAADLFRRATQLAQPVRAMLESRHPGELPTRQSYLSVSVDGPGDAIASAIKPAEDQITPDAADTIVRVFESSGREPARATLSFGGRTWTTELGPSVIRTFLVPGDASEPVVETDLLERPLQG